MYELNIIGKSTIRIFFALNNLDAPFRMDDINIDCVSKIHFPLACNQLVKAKCLEFYVSAKYTKAKDIYDNNFD